MKYYSREGDFNKLSDEERIITVDRGVKQIQKDFLFTIKDPFDEPHNPGRVKLEGNV